MELAFCLINEINWPEMLTRTAVVIFCHNFCGNTSAATPKNCKWFNTPNPFLFYFQLVLMSILVLYRESVANAPGFGVITALYWAEINPANP